MDSTFLSLLLGAIVLLVLYLIKCYRYWSKHGIPCPKGSVPLLGHFLPVLTMQQTLPNLCYKFYETFPNTSMIGFYKTVTPVLMVREPELVKTVLQSSFTDFHENSANIDPSVDPLLAKNPFFTYGEAWTTGRKRLTYAFSSMRLKILFESVKGVCKKFVNFLDRNLKKDDKYEVELKDLFSKFTGEVVANAGFGIEGMCFEDEAPPSSFRQIGRTVFELDMVRALVASLMFFIPEFSKIFKIPFITKEVDHFFRSITEEVLKNRRKETVPRNDFFQLMMELEKTDGETLDPEVLAAHAFSFFTDGYETSSATLSFVGYQLAVHKDVQQRLREEIRSVLSKHNDTLTYEALKEMTYLDQVISESQRRFPAVGMLTKKCTQEHELKGSDGLRVRVKPGTEVVIPIHGLHMNSTYWPDPDTFDPERFNEDRKQDIEKFTFLPFGEGPRMCVGFRMALVQMKACLATLIKSYTLELSPKTKTPIKLSVCHFLSAPEGGFWVYIKRI